jgi:hypothetical protein
MPPIEVTFELTSSFELVGLGVVLIVFIAVWLIK